MVFHGQIMEKPWKTMGFTGENHGKKKIIFFPWKNHGKAKGRCVWLRKVVAKVFFLSVKQDMLVQKSGKRCGKTTFFWHHNN